MENSDGSYWKGCYGCTANFIFIYGKAFIAGKWLKSGLPSEKKRKPRTPAQICDAKKSSRLYRAVKLTTDDALTIACASENRSLPDMVIRRTGPGQKALVQLLKDFWDLECSNYN
ncbi:MAG: hypothetical protein LBP23_06675 [Treponema sp.]|nr:hypothetical protein [Treponema sp.]